MKHRALLRRALFTLVAAWSTPCTAQPTVDSSVNTIWIYFPPAPPALGESRERPAVVPLESWPAPARLAAYIDAPFYAPLSTRMEKNDIDDSLSFRLESYTAAKTALLAELRAQLYTLKTADPDTRARTLAALARDQTPRIAALEDTAERLRQDLGASGSGWKEYVRWRVGLFSLPAQPPPARPLLLQQQLEAAIYYEHGLSPEQRRLLLEQSREWSARISGVPAAANSADILGFSPNSARIELPPDLPPNLAQQIAAYRAQKAALKADLDAALFGPDKESEAPGQIAALEALAARQHPGFAALEAQAEAIRRGLAVIKDPLRPADLPPIPGDLATRIATYRTEMLSLQKGLLAQVEAAKRSSGADQGPKIQQAIADYTRDNAARYAALNRDLDSIRSDLAKLPGTPSEAGVSPDALLMKFSRSLRDLERSWDYRDYQTAVLQPGLSPEQRRLLFEGALEKLALPLPSASLKFGSL